MSLVHAAHHVAAQGRGNDSMLVHMTPNEVKGLQALAKAHGGSLTVNPHTGLVEAGFLDKVLPVVAGAALTAMGLPPMASAALIGGVYSVRGNSLKSGLMAGLGAYGGASMASSFAPTAEVAAEQTATQGAEQAAGQEVAKQTATETARRAGTANIGYEAPSVFPAAAPAPTVQVPMAPPTGAPGVSAAVTDATTKAAPGFLEANRGAITAGYMGLNALAAQQQPGMPAQPKAPPGHLRPYAFSYQPTAEQPGATWDANEVGEHRYFTPTYTAKPITKLAEGGESIAQRSSAQAQEEAKARFLQRLAQRSTPATPAAPSTPTGPAPAGGTSAAAMYQLQGGAPLGRIASGDAMRYLQGEATTPIDSLRAAISAEQRKLAANPRPAATTPPELKFNLQADAPQETEYSYSYDPITKSYGLLGMNMSHKDKLAMIEDATRLARGQTALRPDLPQYQQIGSKMYLRDPNASAPTMYATPQSPGATTPSGVPAGTPSSGTNVTNPYAMTYQDIQQLMANAQAAAGMTSSTPAAKTPVSIPVGTPTTTAPVSAPTPAGGPASAPAPAPASASPRVNADGYLIDAEGNVIRGNSEWAKGGAVQLEHGGFVVPADVVSALGNGSSSAGLDLLAKRIGARPIKGPGDGMSDSIPTTIGGKQRAAVARDEAYVPAKQVAKLGGADKLYAMMDTIRSQAHGKTSQQRKVNPRAALPNK